MNVKKMYFYLYILIIASCTITPANQSNGVASGYRKGMVVSAQPEASKIGLATLQQGGNAIDAAVSTAFALAVCHPTAGNIGGGGFMVLRFADGKNDAIDFRETAPKNATRDMYLDKKGDFDMRLSTETHLASGIPGSVDGLLKVHAKYGKLPLNVLIQPAIDLARKGFPLTEKLASSLNHNKSAFLKRNKTKTAFTNATAWKTGDTLRQEELTQTLELIRDKGRAGFYEGATAEKIVAEMKRGNGIINREDLKNYSSKWRTPMIGKYKDYKVITMPPPSSGGIALLQMLRMIERFPLSKWGFDSPDSKHLMIEAERRAYADRAKYLGDADYFEVPVNDLLDSTYIDNRIKNFNQTKATPSGEIGFTIPIPHESTETTHFSIVDSAQNAVSCTTTINSAFGSKIVVTGAGFILNNEMDDFSAKPNAPNQFELIGNEANAIKAGKRMLSSMTPTILEKNGKLYMVVGSPGGAFIITAVFQTILNVIEFDMSMQNAVATKRFHHQWMPDEVKIETGVFNDNLMKQLEARGHKFKDEGKFARVDAILIHSNGILESGADPRGDDCGMGY